MERGREEEGEERGEGRGGEREERGDEQGRGERRCSMVNNYIRMPNVEDPNHFKILVVGEGAIGMREGGEEEEKKKKKRRILIYINR